MIIKQDRENFHMLNFLDKFMMGHKGYIAGGCFKNIFNGEKIKDIDIFFDNEEEFYCAVEYFDRQTEGYTGDNALTVQYNFYTLTGKSGSHLVRINFRKAANILNHIES